MTNGIPQTSFNFKSAIVFELNPLTHWKSLGVKIFLRYLNFWCPKNFACEGRDIYTLHEEQEYIGLDLILCSSIGTHLPYYL